MRLPHLLDLPAGAAHRGRPRRVRKVVTSVVDWLRAGYPEEAPTTGYSPLLALNGPISLTGPRLVSITSTANGAL